MSERSDPYHSTRKGRPHVHHIFADRNAGRLIPERNRSDGTHGYPLCGTCKAMEREAQSARA